MIVAAAIAVGALVTLAITGQLSFLGGADATSSSNTQGNAVTPPRGGKIAFASVWFDSEFTSSDSYPFETLLTSNGLEPNAVRFVLSGSNGWDFWVGRTDTTLCLLAAHSADSTGTINCSNFADFAARGIDLSLNDLEAHWDGGWVTTDPPTPDEPRVPAAPGAGSGDVTAANSWFAEPPEPSDEFPYPGNLVTQDVDVSQVRLAETQNVPWAKIWVAQQSTTGYCLIATTDREGYLSQVNCATLDEFRTSGLSIAAPGIAAYWDGNEVLATR